METQELENVSQETGSEGKESEETVLKETGIKGTEIKETEPKKRKKQAGIIAGIGAAAVIAIAGSIFAFIKVTEKDPKEVVIQAFENIYTDDQVDPAEELFGLSQFMENASTVDMECGLALTLDSSSSAEIDEFAGSGFKVSGMYDRTNEKTRANVGMIYKDMDLLNMELYYGENQLMAAIPEISSRVFFLDLSEGLGKRLQESPVIGPVLEENGINGEAIEYYLNILADEVKSQSQGESSLDLKAAAERFLDGWQTREKLKEAMTVEKAEKEVFVVDDKEVTCKGYHVMISKEFMIDFMEGSTDFFLNDEELKEIYIEQLEQSVKLAELMGEMTSGMSPEQMREDLMDDMTDSIEEMINYLDKTLNDIDMTVYVDKKGRLAAVNGTTILTAESGEERDNIQVSFDMSLQGGSYLTQNMEAEVTMKNESDRADLEIKKQGTYDGTRLTNDISVDVVFKNQQEYSLGAAYTDTFEADSGDYHIGASVTANGYLLADLSVTGVVSQLDKGISAQVDIDELQVVIMNDTGRVTLSGEYYFRPLSKEVKAPKGKEFDLVGATEEEWAGLAEEVFLNLLNLLSQLGVEW